MAPNPIFGRDDKDGAEAADDPARGDGPNEGVRVLGADEVAKAAERAETAKRRGPDEKKYGDRPEAPPADVKPAMRFPLADAADPNALQRLRPAPVTRPTADDPTGSRPVISVGPPTGETQLPHWTEPPTGEVPKVIIGEGDEIDEDRWAAFADAPRWRDENTDWSREDAAGFDDLAHDDDVAIGALDERDRMMDEDYLTFDDLDVPAAESPKAPARGSAADPIKIQRSGRPAPAPVPSAPVGGRPRPRPRPDGEARPAAPAAGGSTPDRQQKIQVGIAIAVGALVIFLLGAYVQQWFPLVLIVAAIVGSLAEFFNASARAGFRPLRWVGLVAGAALPLAAYNAGTQLRPQGESGMMLVLFLTIAASMAWYLFGAGRGRPVANIAITLTGVLYVGVLGSYGALILRAGPWANQLPGTQVVIQGVAYFILIALGTTTYDAVGYLAGSRIGKTPLSAASPNKTREGLAAGMAASFVVVVLFGALGLGVQNIVQAVVLAVVVAVVAPIGDLFESMVKRDLGVKDMGDVIPAHGGLLDRLDAYLFTLPAAYYTLRMLGLIA